MQNENMMIETAAGNILKSDAEALVNPVNCRGVMGRGLAAQFKRAFPKNFKAYENECSGWKAHISGKETLRPGRVFVFEENEHWIFNFPTKDDWKNDSRLEWIASGLASLVAEVKVHNIRSIAIPALGCGEGRLLWSDVFPLIESAAAEMPNVRVIVFPPQP